MTVAVSSPFTHASPSGARHYRGTRRSGHGNLHARKPASVVHFSIDTPERASLFPFDERGIGLSPDGSKLAFVAASEDARRLIYLPGAARPMFSLSNQLLASSLAAGLGRGSLIGGVTPDGGKFLFRSSADEKLPSLNVVMNWQSMLLDHEK
ncbi:MAG: hypothetical protein ABIP63_03015 [Thermoanaerobaculia bacterium]